MHNPARIFFRCDASYAIGTGHVMRGLTLAKALRGAGATCVFLCDSSLDGHLNQHIAEHGFAVHDPDFLSAEEDKVDWLVVDHYSLDQDYERASRQYTRNIMVIDDLADRPHDCDILLDQNLHDDMEGRYEGVVPPSCQMLLGPHFALIRDEFTQWRGAKPALHDDRRVFVNFGGADPDDVTSRALEQLKNIGTDHHFIVVAGAKSHHLDRIKAMCAGVPNFELHIQPPNMAELMASCAFAIGAGGTTSWERCCLSLPALIITIADNQLELTATLHAQHAVMDLGFLDQGLSALADAFKPFAAHKAELKNRAEIAHNICDGLGVARVVDCLNKPVKLIDLKMSDAEILYEWQSHPLTRTHFISPDIPTWDEHVAWLTQKLSEPHQELFIIAHHGAPAGFLRLENTQNNQYEISLLVAPDFYRMGLAQGALQAVHMLKKNAILDAHILPANEKSRQLFQKMGYKSIGNNIYRFESI